MALTQSHPPRLKRRLLEEETERIWKKRRANITSCELSPACNATSPPDNTCARLEITTESNPLESEIIDADTLLDV